MSNKSEDRGMMKWAPFYSVLSEKEIQTSIDSNETYSKPELSEDQIYELENTIVDAYNNKKEVEIKIFESHKFTKKQGIINKLDPIHKAIYLDKKLVLFSNIIDIKIIEKK